MSDTGSTATGSGEAFNADVETVDDVGDNADELARLREDVTAADVNLVETQRRATARAQADDARVGRAKERLERALARLTEAGG